MASLPPTPQVVHSVRGNYRAQHVEHQVTSRRVSIPAVYLSPLPKERACKRGSRRLRQRPPPRVERNRHSEWSEQRQISDDVDHPNWPRHERNPTDTVPMAGRIESAPGKNRDENKQRRADTRCEVPLPAFR